MNKAYFKWLIQMVDDDKHIVLTHQKLLEELFCTVYYTSTPDDLNRAGDGVALRARYVMLTHDTGDEIECLVMSPWSVNLVMLWYLSYSRVIIVVTVGVEAPS